MKHTVLITGAAGYVGTMLAAQLARREDVVKIIGLDKEPVPDFIAGESKLVYLECNTADAWEEEVAKHQPDIVVHAAWQIREIYGDRALTWKWNIEGSDRVFNYALNNPEVKRLVYFSTVASYGSFPQNTVEHRYAESEPFRESEYLYAEEKRIAEQHLETLYAQRSNKDIAVSIIRPAAITGPRGRFVRIRFGLQAALSGQLRDSAAYGLVTKLVSFVPVTKKWCRQFVHEDDIADMVELLALGPVSHAYEVFNAAPPGPVVRGVDMARAVGKRLFRVHPQLVRLAFFIFWHLTRGKIPTGRGAWRGYSYPIVVDGSKITERYGFTYSRNSYDAFYRTSGRFERFVPEDARR
jgi:nucleoside-diphosphate-sugar epimerase